MKHVTNDQILNLVRYEIFMDEVKPQDLSLAFLREFLNLPNSYFDAGAPLKFRKYMFLENDYFFNNAPGKRIFKGFCSRAIVLEEIINW